MKKGKKNVVVLLLQNFLIILLSTFFLNFQSTAQQSSIIVLGDLHYDLQEDHDQNWLQNKPDDVRQIKEYTAWTNENWSPFMTILKERALNFKSPVKVLVQLGDLSEGLAGTEEKAAQMASHAMKAIDDTQMPVPWIIAKGNHDITGPGAIKAFQEYYVPMFRKQTNNQKINNASYSYRHNNIQITCVDPWDKETDMVAFLEKELSESTAKFNFVAIHEPVIPVTERCWHVLRNEPQKREKFLEIIAKNKAIVLCGHLHKYSVVSRETKFGPVIQVMVISVVKDRNYIKPTNVIQEYGASLAENVPEWQPQTIDARKNMLAEEANFVTYFKQTDLPGYAIITVDEKEEKIQLEYYAAFNGKPYDTVNLTKLLHP
ncbi:MAG TPA: metallophosphoesterase [Draconibacterium sp.]|nr:metallophosphoesterase [Draconibacterium sp.]